MSPKVFNLAFLGSDEIALPVLRFLNDSCPQINVSAILTQPDRRSGRGRQKSPNKIKKWALGNLIPVESPEKPGDTECEWLSEKNIDIILVMAYGHILKRNFLEFAPAGCFNLHASILPKYRGASPIETAIAMGENETGVTLIRVIPKMDAGPIVDVQKVTISSYDTGVSVRTKIGEACVPLMNKNIDSLCSGNNRELEQDSTSASYCRKLKKEDGNLDFNFSAFELVNRIRAFESWPGCGFIWNSQKIRIGSAIAVENDWSLEPGDTYLDSNNIFYIGTKDGLLVPQKLQRPGGKMLNVEDFFRGFDFPFGNKLESLEMNKLICLH